MKNRYFIIPTGSSESFWDCAGINLQYQFVVPVTEANRYPKIEFYLTRLTTRWRDYNNGRDEYTHVIFTEKQSHYEKQQDSMLSHFYWIGIHDTLIRCEFKEQIMWTMMLEGAIQIPSPVHQYLCNHPNYHAHVR